MAAKKTSSKVYYYGTGRRKDAVAAVRLVPGKGKITINGKDIDPSTVRLTGADSEAIAMSILEKGNIPKE